MARDSDAGKRDGVESHIRFQQSLIVAARNTIDTFEREVHKVAQTRLDLDKKERELRVSFSQAPDTIDRARKEIARLESLKVGQMRGVLTARGVGRRSDIEKKLARRETLLKQLAEINGDLGLKNGDEVK